ncbi:MAG: RsmD family RNA methyltransferase, partial [Planctomycetota bacterium]|nr:RsmD family RNA methyltransferase [Planctomycetota bacterium]
MRVVAGTARGINLKVPRGARPLLEMARNALFNSLASFISESRVLDLYAGSGALGIEALSRGAAFCVFIEDNPRGAEAIRENLQRTHLAERSQVINSRAEKALAGLTDYFHLIFVDPPFARSAQWGKENDDQTIISATASLLAAEGRLIFRLEKSSAPPGRWGRLALLQSRRYGRSLI